MLSNIRLHGQMNRICLQGRRVRRGRMQARPREARRSPSGSWTRRRVEIGNIRQVSFLHTHTHTHTHTHRERVLQQSLLFYSLFQKFFYCPHCSKKFTTEGAKKTHVREIHPSRVQEFTCEHCKQKFAQKRYGYCTIFEILHDS